MITKIIPYVDFDGNEQKEVANFHLSEADLAKMSLGVEGGMEAYLKKIINEKNTEKIIELFEKIIKMSYGKREGNRFIRTPELTEAFTQTEAYSELFMEIISDEDKASEFIRGVLPTKLSSKLPDELPNELPEGINPEVFKSGE